MTDPTAYGPTASVALGDPQALVNQDYHTMQYTNNTGSDISNGDIVVVNGLCAYALGDIDNGKKGTLVFLTVIDVVKKQEAISQGASVYWDTTGDPYGRTAGTGAATGTAASHYFMGKAIAAAAETAGRVKVLLMPSAANTLAYIGATMGNILSGGAYQGTREASATQNYPLGTRRVYADGRVFRYIKARTALHTEFGACYAAKTVANAVAPAQATDAGSIGDVLVTMTVGATDGLAGDGVIAVNELVGGYVVIGNGASQHPQNRVITANTVVAAGGGACTLTLDEALDQDVTPSTTNIETLMNPWILSDGYATNSAYVTFRGMPACEMSINEYGWVQTRGPCWITSNGDTCNSANDRNIYFAANGSVVSGGDVTQTDDHPIYQFAGVAIDMSSNGGSNAPFVDLQLDQC